MTSPAVLVAVGLVSSCASTVAAPQATTVALGSSQGPEPEPESASD